MNSTSAGITPARAETGLPDEPVSVNRLMTRLLSRDNSVRNKAFAKIKADWLSYRKGIGAMAARGQPAMQLAVAYVLARLATKQDLPALRKSLSSTNKYARGTAMTGLARLRDRESMALMVGLLPKALFEETRKIFATMLAIDPKLAEKAIMAEHSSPEWARRRAVAIALGGLDTEASATALLIYLKDPTWLVKMDAARALGNRKVRAALEPLRKLIDDPSTAVRGAAAYALGKFGLDADVSLVTRLALSDESRDTRRDAILALAGFEESLACASLKLILDKREEHEEKGEHDEKEEHDEEEEEEENEKVMAAAVETLGRMTSLTARKAFQEYLARDDEELQEVLEEVIAEKQLPWKKVDGKWQFQGK